MWLLSGIQGHSNPMLRHISFEIPLTLRIPRRLASPSRPAPRRAVLESFCHLIESEKADVLPGNSSLRQKQGCLASRTPATRKQTMDAADHTPGERYLAGGV